MTHYILLPGVISLQSWILLTGSSRKPISTGLNVFFDIVRFCQKLIKQNA